MQLQARPVGVTILAVIAILGGVVSVVVGFSLIKSSTVVATASTTTLTGSIAVLFGALGVVSGLLELAFGIGAFQRSSWAWRFGIGTYVFNFLYYVATIFVDSAHHSTAASTSANVVSAIIALVIIAYINSAQVKRYFGRL